MNTHYFSLVFAILCTLLRPSTAKANIYEPNVLWDKRDIKVCFYDQPDQITLTNYSLDKAQLKKQGFTPDFLSNEAKAKIKTVIEANYTVDSTEINFYGWDGCSQSPDSDVIIMRAAKIDRKFWLDKQVRFLGKSSIGQGGVLTNQGFLFKNLIVKPVVLFKSTESGVISHEFGHLAGLRHEHVHPTAKAKKECEHTLINENLSTAVVNSYDPDSIMSYCKVTKQMEDGRLSASDKALLKFIYSKI